VPGPGGLPFAVEGRLPDLVEPTLVVALTGWIDASGAAAAAMDHLIAALGARTIVTFDGDTFIDHRARRPVMELRDGVNTRISWPVPEVRHGRDDAARDVLLLTGPEPDTAWHLFADTVAQLAHQMGVVRMVGLGAYPYAAPHTRPIGITATSPDAAVVERLGYTRSSLDAPAGVTAVLEHSLHTAGIEAFGLWAQVPHYVASMAHPAASAALVEELNRTTGLTVDPSTLRAEATIQRERLDQLVASNPEHAEMLRTLEAAHDAATPPMTAIETPIPSVDEIAAQVEQFLRDQQGGSR